MTATDLCTDLGTAVSRDGTPTASPFRAGSPGGGDHHPRSGGRRPAVGGRIRRSARHRNTARRPDRDAGPGCALTSDRPETDPLLIGSVRDEHRPSRGGAGVAGLVKAALVAKHGYIPANLHLRAPSRHVNLPDLKIDIPATGRPFPDGRRRVVGVNSFGFGGTNAPW